MNNLLTEDQIIDGLALEMLHNPCVLGSYEFILWNQGFLFGAQFVAIEAEIPQKMLDEAHPALVEGVEAGTAWAKKEVEKGAAHEQ